MFLQLCAEEWRPSRLESECVQGDGIVISFSTQDCSPFTDKRMGKTNLVSFLFIKYIF